MAPQENKEEEAPSAIFDVSTESDDMQHAQRSRSLVFE
jgi:hypothetical protein